MLICSGDRDNFQLVSDTTTVLYPVRGVSELWRMDPQAVLDKYGVPPERYPDLAALVGETSDNLPGVPGRRAEDRGEVDHHVRRPARRRRERRPDQGQGGREPARAPGRRAAQPPAQRPGPRPRAAARPGGPGPAAVGPRRGAPGLRRPGVPGAARAAVRDGGRAGARGGVGLRPGHRAAGLGGRRPAGWPSTPARASAPGVHVVGTLGRGGRATPGGWRSPPADESAGYVDLEEPGRGRAGGGARLAGRPRAARRPCTTRRARGTRCASAACRCAAW